MANDDVASSKSFSLAELGLVYESDGSSKPQLRIIDLDVDPRFGTATCQAVYNEDTKRWRVVTNSHMRLANGSIPTWKSPVNNSPESRPNYGKRAPDWTDRLPRSKVTESFRNGVDWAATSLGPLQTWPISLQTMVNAVFADSRGTVLYWGPDLVAIPNQVMLDGLLGRLHKDENFMGRSFRDNWPELWQDFQHMFTEIRQTGVGANEIEVNLFPVKNGVKEETYWTGDWVPIRDESGDFAGLYNVGFESTMKTMRERRLKTLNAIASPQHPGTPSVWDHVFGALHNNERDMPMAFAYSAMAHVDGELDNYKLHLEQSLGVPEHHSLVPHDTSLFEGSSGFQPFFRKAKATNRVVVLRRSEGNLPDELVKGFTWRGFGEPSGVLAIFPISAGETLKGMMVVGFNPRRPWNEDYEGFIFSLHSQISATVSAALDHEESRQRAARLTLELQESERQIRDLAEYAPIGMCRVSPTGTVLWANDQFYDLTGHPKGSESQYDLSFVDVVAEEDQAAAAKAWPVLVEQQKDISINIRLKRKWKPPAIPGEPEPQEEPIWVLSRSYPVVQDGVVRSVAAAVVDISHYKWAAAVQERAAKAAKDAKRLQENFIDIVSHEMRNPLSAITQLSDAISASMDDFDSSRANLSAAKEILESNVESAKTILICAAHQKRIIDDVLTLSKLDSMMLSITPVVVQPYSIVDSVLKMFEGEFSANDIKVNSILDESYHNYKVDWVCVDPSRVTQIFINLITNAIKFTKLEHRREINIRTSASMGVTPKVEGLTWYPSNTARRDITNSPEWGTGEHLYLCYQVTDTGAGLEQGEMMKLFTRFQQASAKTHIKYGGSGLGLFISRQLTENQGGEIGVISQPGVGSTFAFYVKGRRAATPASPEQVLQPPEPANQRRRSAGYSSPEPSTTSQASTASMPRPKASRSKSSSTQISLAKPAILMVEDNVVNAKVLSTQLAKAGCTVQVANHGMEALDLLYPSHASSKTPTSPLTPSKSMRNGNFFGADFDVILMDVEMPVMDGLTATRRIREIERERKTSKRNYIVAITANARQEQIDETINAGADTVVSKPFRVAELMSKIKEVMAAKQQSSLR